MLAMQALNKGDVRIVEVPVPTPSDGQVLVKMELASICGSDLHIVDYGWLVDEYPLRPGYPGHEGIGTVVNANGTELTDGDRVLVTPAIWDSLSFAEYQALGTNFLTVLPEATDQQPDHLLMAQQLGTVIFAARELPALNGETVVVIGQGSAGLFHDYWLRRMGAGRIITVEPNKPRREAGRMFDVDDVLDVTGQAAVDAVLDLTNGVGADLIVDAVGGGDTLNQAISMVKPAGHVHIFGLPSSYDKVPFDLGGFFMKRVKVSNTFGAQDEPGLPAFREALDLIEQGEIDMAPFVTDVFPLERVDEALALAHEPSGGTLKVSLTMD